MPVFRISNQCAVMQSLVQYRIAAQVRVSNCLNVLAVTVPMECGRVLMIQFAIQAPKTDLPVPWPLDMAIRIGITGSVPRNPLAFTCAAGVSRRPAPEGGTPR